MGLAHDMAEDHERRLAERLGGRKTRGSGNQAANPLDGRHSRYRQRVAFAWDCKSTRAASVGVTKQMWEKAKEQAHGERPMLALAFYEDDRLRNVTDLVVLSLDDFAELLALVNGEIA